MIPRVGYVGADLLDGHGACAARGVNAVQNAASVVPNPREAPGLPC